MVLLLKRACASQMWQTQRQTLERSRATLAFANTGLDRWLIALFSHPSPRFLRIRPVVFSWQKGSEIIAFLLPSYRDPFLRDPQV